MTLNRYAKRRDSNHAEICAALKRAGCDIIASDTVDLIVGRAGATYCIEIKSHKEAQLRPIQRWLRESWRGHYAIVTSVDEALKAVGL